MFKKIKQTLSLHAISSLFCSVWLASAFAQQPIRNDSLTVYRNTAWAGLATAIEFELNGERKQIGALSDVKLQPKEGLNEFKKVAAYYFGSKEQSSNAFIEEKFYFNYKRGDLLKIGISHKEPSLLSRLEKDGTYVVEKKLSQISTFHTINLSPENASIKMVEAEGRWEKIVYENSNVKPQIAVKKIPLRFEIIEGTSGQINVIVRWDTFNAEEKYTIQLTAGKDSERTVSIPPSNFQFLNYQLSQISEKDKPDFVCKNGMHSVYKKYDEYDECISSMSEESKRLAQEEKLKIEQIEFNEKLVSKEGLFCSSKLRKTHTKDEFITCHTAEVLKSIAAKKFADAVATNEGEQCKKKFRNDGSEFWKCFEKNVAEVKQKQKEKEEKEFEELKKKTDLANLLQRDDIARQCVEIGFEIGTSTYKDCYLKLKLHTEQIAEWRRLQAALQNQSNTSSRSQPIYGAPNSSANNLDDAARLLDIAQRGFSAASGANNVAPMMQPPPPPMQIITPRGNSYNCSMMGAALRCR